MSTTPHILIIGGTGMLRGVAIECAQRGWRVSVLARRAEPLMALADEAADAPGTITTLTADYTNSEALRNTLREHFNSAGVPSAVVAWIHDTAPDAPRLIAEEITTAGDVQPVDFIHIVSRLQTDDPEDHSMVRNHPATAQIRNMNGLRYRQAILGWIIEPNGSRWLSHNEIAGGVINTIDNNQPVTSIGAMEPIESNPTNPVR